MTKIEIKELNTDKLLFEFEKENNSNRADLSYANLHGTYLSYANLHGTDLHGSDLSYANLHGADLRGADLRDANLYGVNLYGADLRDANLYGVDLSYANLYGADLRGANLCDVNNGIIGKIEDWMSYDNINSRKSRTLVFKTDKGVFINCECFFGDLENFVEKVKETHQGNKHEKDYLSLVEFIKVRFEI